MKENRNLAILRSSLLTALMTFLSRITGLVREQVRGYFLGTGIGSDAFGLAATIPNLLRRLLAEGAMTAAFVPVFSEYVSDGDKNRLSQFVSRFFTIFIILTGLVTLLGVLASPLIIRTFFSKFGEVEGKLELTEILTQIMFPYLFFVSAAAMVQAVLNSFKIFAPSAFTPVLLNVAGILIVILFHDSFPDASYSFAIGFLVGGFLQVAFQLPYLRGKGIVFKPSLMLNDPGVKRVFVIFLPGIFSAGIYQINVFASQIIASFLEEGSIASLQFSLRLQELVLGIFAVSVATVILPAMSQMVYMTDFLRLKETLAYSIRTLGFITIPASVGLVLLAEPVVRLLFEYGRFDAHSTKMTVWALYFHSSGIFFIAIQRNIVQVFYAMKDLKTPTIVSAIVMVLHIALCYLFAIPLDMGNGGVALAGSLAALINVMILYWILWRRIGELHPREVIRSLLKIFVSTAAMCVVIFLFDAIFELSSIKNRLKLGLLLAAVITVSTSFYLLVSYLLKCGEMKDLIQVFRKKFNSSSGESRRN